jgi:hypothetical protein
MYEAQRESDPWFSRIRSELKTEGFVKFHTKILLSPLRFQQVLLTTQKIKV